MGGLWWGDVKIYGGRRREGVDCIWGEKMQLGWDWANCGARNKLQCTAPKSFPQHTAARHTQPRSALCFLPLIYFLLHLVTIWPLHNSTDPHFDTHQSKQQTLYWYNISAVWFYFNLLIIVLLPPYQSIGHQSSWTQSNHHIFTKSDINTIWSSKICIKWSRLQSSSAELEDEWSRWDANWGKMQKCKNWKLDHHLHHLINHIHHHNIISIIS